MKYNKVNISQPNIFFTGIIFRVGIFKKNSEF